MPRQVNLGQIVPNIQIGTTTTGNPSTPASVINVGTDLNPILNFVIPKGEAGAIKMIIVNELPSTGQDDTIYLVPLEEPESQENRYAEYVWVNNQWELLGKIGIEVDLTNYYTKQETYSKSEVNNLIPDLTDYVKNTDYASSSKGGVIKSGYYGLQVDSSNGKAYCDTYNYSNYGNLENQRFISKGTLENVITGKDLTTKTYVDGLVGDIGTAIDLINGESVGD